MRALLAVKGDWASTGWPVWLEILDPSSNSSLFGEGTVAAMGLSANEREIRLFGNEQGLTSTKSGAGALRI